MGAEHKDLQPRSPQRSLKNGPENLDQPITWLCSTMELDSKRTGSQSGQMEGGLRNQNQAAEQGGPPKEENARTSSTRHHGEGERASGAKVGRSGAGSGPAPPHRPQTLALCSNITPWRPPK